MLHEHTKSVHMLDAQEIAIGANQDGVDVDCTGWDKLSVQINAGAIGAGGTLTVKAQAGGVDIAGASVDIAAADDQATYEMDIDLRELDSKTVNVNAAAAVGAALVAVSGRLYRGNVMLPPTPENDVTTV